MTSLEFEATSPLFPRATRGAARPQAAGRSGRASLAIISVFDELCGIAAYTQSLQKQLSESYEVTVFELDQYLLRATHRTLRQMADQHIKQICRDIASFDAVNLQLEHGTLGRRPVDIYRRFSSILAAAPQLSVTFHTMIASTGFDFAAWLRAAARLRFGAAMRIKSEYVRRNLLSVGIARRLRRAQRSKHVALIVHNRRDLRQMQYVYKLRNVHDHPLSFLGPAEAREIRSTAARARFPLLDAVPEDARLVGVFGFLGRYKGFDTVVRAMQHLPPHYHLLIFGGVHPNEIHPQQPINPYVATLLDAAYVDTNLFERLKTGAEETAPALSLALDASLRDVLTAHPRDLSGRIHFMGALSRGDFLAGMAVCDTVVMPYLEVGQSASGPISQALELGCRTLASRTQTFLQLSRYHRDTIEFFDIGNHLELATRIVARPQFDPRERLLAYNVETNKATYLAANPKPSEAAAFAPRRPALSFK